MLTFDDARNHPLWSRQMELEEEMRSLGVKRFNDAAQAARESGRETRVKPVRRLMTDAHAKMVDGIKAFFEEVESKKAGRKHSAYHYLRPLNLDLVAHLTCRIILDTVVQRPSLTHLSVMIGEALEDEMNYRHFESTHNAGFLKAASRAKKTSNERFRRRSVLSAASRIGVDLIEWPKRDMVLVGSKLIEIFVETTGLVSLNKTKTSLTVEMKPESRQWIEEECRRSEWLSPMYLPTVVPPKPWTSPFEGGYWSGRARRLTLVKTGNRAYLQELTNCEMPEVYQAINALQSTGWMINRRVHDVMLSLWDNHSTLGMLPAKADELEASKPEKPFWLVEGMKKEDMTAEQLEAFVKWKSDSAAWHDERATAEGKRIAFSRMLWVADKFRDDEFFYPHQLDWRGRAYPVGLYLQPQGNDAQRGLLEFSTACPINTQEAADWLAIHGAGLWGVDKVSLQERVQWVLDNEERIMGSANDPYGHLFWTEAEKPWQALSFCFEWLAFRLHGWGYLSSLPVQMDGTCNGLQNFSAMLLDPIGGVAVNLVPNDKPQDIYQRVADIVSERVMADLSSEDRLPDRELKDGTVIPGPYKRDLAAMWAGNVTRKVCKRPVMTLAYGARKYGFTEQVNDDTVKKWKKESPETYPFGNHGWAAAQYMGEHIWEAVGEVVVAARKGMDWLQGVARTVSEEKLPINWTTPTGFLVQQNYKVRNMKAIELAFQKVRLQVYVDAGSDKLDTKKQASGISPNWVHSLDASHMMRTICVSNCAGVESFSFIHDSYGTHAGNCPALSQMLREEFVRMYSEQCVLSTFKEDLEAMLDGKTLKPVPDKGTLDLSLVLDSQFFFA